LPHPTFHGGQILNQSRLEWSMNSPSARDVSTQDSRLVAVNFRHFTRSFLPVVQHLVQRLLAAKRISQNGYVRLLSPIFPNLHQTTFTNMRQWRNQQLTVVNRIGKVLTTSTSISPKSQASVVSQRRDLDGNHLEAVIPSHSITATSVVRNGVELRKAMK